MRFRQPGHRGLTAIALAAAMLVPSTGVAESPSSAVPGITARDWPSWRGPTHDGHAAAGQRVPTTWSDTQNVVWSADVPGRGSSSPTVVGDRVYLTTCDEAAGSQSVLAFDRIDGRHAWTRRVHASGAMWKNERSTGASSSVACDGERLFVVFPTSGSVVVTALSLGGEQVWQVTLCDYLIHQGYGASPFIHGDTVIVCADHRGGGALAALDRRTGAVVWKRERPPAPNYSSPIVFRLLGRDQLILTGCDKVISCDPATGTTLWERDGATTECVTTPVTDGTRIFTSGGYPKNHVSAVRADGSATIDWENGEREYVPSMIFHEGHLYGVLDAGIAVCWNAATGEKQWKARLGGNFSASPVFLDGRVYATNEAGETHVFRARPDRLETLGVNKLGDEAFATLAICGDRMYFRVASLRDGTRRERLVCVAETAKPDPGESASDPTRPTYHLLSAQANPHVADPNFAFFWKGKYHLFYISKGYAHVSSADLLHWRRHPPFHGPLCSGGIFVAKDGRPTVITTSAWENGKPVLYTALDDDLEKWSAPVAIEAEVRPDQNVSTMVCWDPDIWVDGDTTYALQGVHPLIAGKEATLLKSKDQKRWEYVGPFLSREMPDVMRNALEPRKNEDISCPNFFKIGDKWMLLCISHIRGCRYYLGEWKNEQFTPEAHGRMNWCLSDGMKDGDHGGEVFAPESLLTPDGRRVMWAWIFALSQKKFGPTWKEALSLPRELSLPEDGVLRIKPLRELEQLRESPFSEQAVVVEPGKPHRLEGFAGDAIEIMATIQQGDATRYGLRVLCDEANDKGIDVVFDPAAKSLRLGGTTAPLDLKPGEDIQLRVFVDRSIVEVFANHRQAVVKQHEYAPGDTGVCLFSEGGQMNVRELKAWKMAATNP